MADFNKYIDPVGGNNSNDGDSAGTAWEDTAPLDIAGNWPTSGNRLVVNIVNDGDISSNADWRVRRDLLFVPPNDNYGVTLGGGGAARIFNCTSSPSDLTITFGRINVDGANCTTEWASVRENITLDGTNTNFINSQARGFKVDGGHTIANLTAPNSTWTTQAGISSFRGFITNTVSATAVAISGDVDLDNASITVDVNTVSAGFAAFTLQGAASGTRTLTADNLSGTATIASGTASAFGFIRADDFSTIGILLPTLTMTFNGNASFAPRFFHIEASNISCTLDIKIKLLSFITDTAPSSTGRALVQIGDSDNAVDANFTNIDIHGYDATGIGQIKSTIPNSGDLGFVGVKFNRVGVAAKGDADVHHLKYSGLFRAVDFFDSLSCRSYVSECENMSDTGSILKFTGNSNNVHANYTLIGSLDHEAGFMQANDGATPVKTSEFVNNLCFIKADADYSTGSHYIVAQGTTAANGQIESARTVAHFLHNLYFQGNKFDLAGSGDTAPVGSPLPFDFDAYNAGAGNPNWKLNNTIYEWILNFAVDKTTPVWDSGHFTFNELTIDPQFADPIDGPWIPRNPAIQSAGYKWWESGETIYDLNNVAFTDTPPIGAYNFTGVYPLPSGGGIVSIITKNIIGR